MWQGHKYMKHALDEVKRINKQGEIMSDFNKTAMEAMRRSIMTKEQRDLEDQYLKRERLLNERKRKIEKLNNPFLYFFKYLFK